MKDELSSSEHRQNGNTNTAKQRTYETKESEDEENVLLGGKKFEMKMKSEQKRCVKMRRRGQMRMRKWRKCMKYRVKVREKLFQAFEKRRQKYERTAARTHS